MTEQSDLFPDRNLAMELVRVTEAAALASGRWVGRGQKNEGDGAAVNAMRKMINSEEKDVRDLWVVDAGDARLVLTGAGEASEFEELISTALATAPIQAAGGN